jgi:hypothetical protein
VERGTGGVSCRDATELYAVALRVGRRHRGEGNGSNTYRMSNDRPLELGWPIMALEGGVIVDAW